MYYKNTTSVGIRSKVGKKPQVIHFGGKDCGVSEAQLRSIADQVMRKLDGGTSVSDANDWADAQVWAESE